MNNDQKILNYLNDRKLEIDFTKGKAFSKLSNTPDKPLGAKTKKGYLRTCFHNNGKQFTVMIHRIIWVAAHGIPLPDMTINHKNGIKTDNKIRNLELVTNFENMRHGKEMGAFKTSGWHDAPRNEKGQFVGKKAAGRLLDGREWNERPT